MGTWGQKTFANDAVLDWLDDLEESAKNSRFLVKWLNYVVKAKNDAAIDDWQEALGAAEVMAASRSEASAHVPKKVYKWINRVGYCASEEDLRLASKAVQKIQQSPSLRDEMTQVKQLAKWDANLTAVQSRLTDARALPVISRVPEKIRRPAKTLADLIVQWGNKPTNSMRNRIRKELALLKNVNKPIKGKGLNPLTPTHWLASRGLLDELKLIVARGGDVNAKLTMLAPPVSFAVKGGHWQAVKYLLDAGADRQKAVITSITADQAGILQMLMELGAEIPDPEVFDSFAKDSWVHVAIESSGFRVLKVLLDLGFDPNAQNLVGSTPLHYCVTYGNFPAAKLLLSHGARTDIRDSNGMTALDFAKKWKKPRFQRLLRSFLAEPI